MGFNLEFKGLKKVLKSTNKDMYKQTGESSKKDEQIHVQTHTGESSKKDKQVLYKHKLEIVLKRTNRYM
jgi:hypothetical protein